MPVSDPARQRSRPQVRFGNKKVHLGIKTGAFYGQEALAHQSCAYRCVRRTLLHCFYRVTIH